MLRSSWLVLGVLCACEQRDAPSPSPPAVAPVDPTVRLEDVPRFAEYRDRKSPYDCTIISALQARFPGTRVEACGAVDLDAAPETVTTARRCAALALDSGRPMVFAQERRGTDSAIADAHLARDEGGAYVAYAAHFDSNPCGGGCADRGRTQIIRCDARPRLAATCQTGATCIECEGPTVETCRNGKPSTVALRDAERARDAMIGTSPASLDLGTLVLGAPYADWTSPDVRKSIEAIEAGGIVSVVEDRPPHGAQIDSIALDFAGPCTRIRNALAGRWGASADDLWLDTVAHRRAKLDLEECRLRVERYHEVDAWVDETATAPMPLAAIGKPAAAFARSVGAPLGTESVRWTVPGIGRAIGVVELDAMVEHGRITSIDARGSTDDATLAQLRARFTALRGAPLRDANGAQIWRGTPPIHLDGDRGSFTISVSTWTGDP